MFETTETKHPALVSWLTHRLDSWRSHRDIEYRQKWEEYYRLWRGIWNAGDKTRDSEKSRLISPALQQAVESSVAELEEATFGRGKWFDIKDDLLDQDKQQAEYIRNLLQEDLEKMGVKDAICEVFLNGAIYGTGIGKIIVEQNVERVPNTAGGEDYAGYKEIPSIDIKVEPISPHNFLIDPSSSSINDGLGVAHEVIKPRYSVIQSIQSGIYYDVPLDGDYDIINYTSENTKRTGDESDNVKITEYWGLVPKRFLKPTVDTDDFEYETSDEMVEAVVTIANDTYILRAVENAFTMKDRPFISYQHDLVPNTFWGRGVCEKGYNAQKALDAEMRARIDSLALTTTPMMAADATRLPRGVKFEVRAGRTILTNGSPKEAVMPLNLGQTDPSTIQQISLLQSMIQMGTGSTDLTGTTGADSRTASGMSMSQSASIKRQKRTLMNFQNTFLIPVINKAIWRKVQFDIDRYPNVDYKFIPYSTMGIMAKELEMTQMVQMMQSIPKDSPAFNIILMALFQNSSIHNRDQIVNAIQQGLQPNPQQTQLQQQALALQLQQAQATIEKTMAEAQEEKAKAMKWQAEAQEMLPNEVSMQEKILKMQKAQADIAKTVADTSNKNSETARNFPEVDHLISETLLNEAKAKSEEVASRFKQ